MGVSFLTDAATTGTTGMLDEVITTVPKVIGLVGDVLSALTATDGDLHPLLGMFAIGIAMSGFKFAIGAIRSVTWGA